MDGTQALLLVAHGSQLSPEAALPALRHAESIRSRDLFDEVATAFWKEEPTLRDALLQVEAENVFVVPVFLAEGYFARTVVPRELGPRTEGDESRIRYCRAVGSHADMFAIAEQRALECIEEEGVAPGEAFLVLAAHGTDLSAGSAGAVIAVADALGARRRFAGVAVGFLDQEPLLVDVLERQGGAHVVVVPWFLAEGLHTHRTIPQALGLTHRHTRTDRRTVHYADPVGTSKGVADVIVALAVEAGARPASGLAAGHRRGTRRTPGGSRARLAAWLRTEGPSPRAFLQLAVHDEGPAGYRVMHRADVRAPVRPPLFASDVRELGRRTVAGHHRPLRAAPDLPAGWTLEARDAEEAVRALAGAYPADVARWGQWHDGRLALVPWRETAARQTGRYSGVHALAGPALARATRACCASAVCLRTPLWSRRRPISPSRPAQNVDRLPCPEACPLFVSLARTALELEGDLQPGAVEMDEKSRYRAVRVLRAAALRLAAEGTVVTADFDHLANPRRLRLLAELLAVRPEPAPAEPRGRWRLRLDAPIADTADLAAALARGISAALEAVSVARRVGCAGGDVRVRARVRSGFPPRVLVGMDVVERPLLGELRRRLSADRSLRPDRFSTTPTVLTVRVATLGDGLAETMSRFDHGVQGAS